MAKITRKVQKIFGQTAGLNQIAQFGSLAASTPTYTTDPDTIQALSNYLQGWFGAVVGSNSPAIEDMNALCYLFAYQLAYLMQEGVPEWNSQTTYYTGSVVNDGSGNLYTSLIDTNLNNALTDGTKWAMQGSLYPTAISRNLTVTSGKSYFYPNYNLASGVTWTVNSGGYLIGAGPVVVSGTLVVNGTARVI